MHVPCTLAQDQQSELIAGTHSRPAHVRFCMPTAQQRTDGLPTQACHIFSAKLQPNCRCSAFPCAIQPPTIPPRAPHDLCSAVHSAARLTDLEVCLQPSGTPTRGQIEMTQQPFAASSNGSLQRNDSGSSSGRAPAVDDAQMAASPASPGDKLARLQTLLSTRSVRLPALLCVPSTCCQCFCLYGIQTDCIPASR